MDINLFRRQKKGFLFRNLSIRLRLPFLIFILLLAVILAFSLVSYIGVKNAALKVGEDRLQSLTERLSTMLSANRKAFIASSVTAANKPAVKAYLLSYGRDSARQVAKIIEDMLKDSATVGVELKNSSRLQMITSLKNGFDIRINIDSILAGISMHEKPDSGRVGNLFAIDSSIYYPVIATVIDKNKPIAYLIKWRKMTTTTKALEQFSHMLGADGRIFAGNDDGRLWTDFRVRVAAPELIARPKGVFQYNESGKNVMGYIRPFVNGTGLVAVELSRAKILETAHHFLRWVILIGILFIAVGIFFAWVMSRNITQPLNKLTAAATAISSGDYSASVEDDRGDELGKLARAFNSMTVQVNSARQNLENKVKERTALLENANQALEAFSYSVSHDLRTPLRVISGYAVILREDHASALNAEANHIIDKMIRNAKMMGRLIDDLLSFSKMGRTEVLNQLVDMNVLVNSCLTELLPQQTENKYRVQLNSLPACYGDADLLKQVWINLISNSLKYSSKHPSPVIDIGTQETPHGTAYYIKDNGAGFDMQHIDKLFGVFQRLHSQKEFEGTGVGLALVKRIINQHNGKIWAEASPGEGATFYFTLSASKEGLAENDLA